MAVGKRPVPCKFFSLYKLRNLIVLGYHQQRTLFFLLEFFIYPIIEFSESLSSSILFQSSTHSQNSCL
jgi:hypothetical protein